MEFLTSCISSSLSILCTNPIDVVKTRYQTNKGNKTNILNVSRNIYRNNGLRGFYRGLGSSLTTYPFYWGIYFQTKDYKFSPTGRSYLDKFIVSFGSGAFASSLTNPLFVVKTRSQTSDSNSKQNNFFNLSKSIYKKEGVLAFYKGFPSTIFNNLKLGIQFPLCDYLQEKTGNLFSSVFISRTVSASLFYPLDLIRVNQRDSREKLSLRKIVKSIYKKQGVTGFYRGILLYNIVNSSCFILMMLFRDVINRNMII